MFKKTLPLILTGALFLTSGCTKEAQTSVKEKKPLEVTTSDSYPIKTDVSLDYWLALPVPVAAYAGSMNEIPLHDELKKETGISVNFIHPPTGQEIEKLNLMIASMDLPDIIECNWLTYPGGAQKAIDEKIILDLSEYVDKVSPNFKKVMEENTYVKKQVTTDSGSYFCYPFITDGDVLATYMGFIIRDDLLKKAGLDQPETIEEWHTVLKKFKEMGVKYPLSIRMTEVIYRLVSPFTGPFGFIADFYYDGDSVKYGPYEPAFRDYVTTLSTWYSEGLIDGSFSNPDKAAYNSDIINGNIGATFCYCGGELGKWLPILAENNSGISFAPTKYPVTEKGGRPMVGQKNQPVLDVGAAITTQCENPEIAARLLDYGYSEKGHMLYNFGTEGVSYNMKDGYPTYTPEILDSDKNGGLAINQAMSKYMRSCSNGPFVQDVRYSEQYMTNPVQREALKLWSDTDMLKYAMPYITMTDDENKKFNSIMKDVTTYEMEMLHKFIAGQEPLSKLDEYFENLKNMGIEDAIKIKDTAYKRFLNK